MSKKSEYLVVLTTCPGSISAKKIARELVLENYAACVNVIPGIQSFFSWVGKVDESNEYLLIIKTTADKYEEMERHIIKIHPYDLPELIALPIEKGYDAYLEWISKNTK